MSIFNQLLREEAGQDLVEYSLMIVFVLIASAIVMQQTGSSILPVWASGSSVVQNAAVLAGS